MVKPMVLTQDQFTTRIDLVKEGMSEREVLALLGSPNQRSQSAWIYNQLEHPRMPRPGETLIVGAKITFDSGVVKKIDRYWIDATGPSEP